MTAPTPPATDRPIVAMRLPSVEAKVQLKKTAIYGLIKTDGFPPPRKLGKLASIWLEHEIDAWLITRPIAADPASQPTRASS